MYKDIEQIFFRPNIFFEGKKNSNWGEPLIIFVISSVGQGLFSFFSTLGNSFDPLNLELIIQPIFINLSIIILLGGIMIILLYISHSPENYVRIFQVLLFTQILWFIFIFISGFFSHIIFNNHFGELNTLLSLWYLFQIVGLGWIIHTILIGVTVITDISYKKGIIPVVIPLIIVSSVYLWIIGFFQFISHLIL